MNWDQELFKRTLDFAAKAHGDQRMQGSNAPYVVHLMKVTTELLAVADGSFAVNLAMPCALLHDCVEDAGVSLDVLRTTFGEAVAAGVGALTKNGQLPKGEQMADSLRRIQAQPREVWMVKLADRITNLEPAPAHWSAEKRARYRAEAQEIHAALGAAHVTLAARLLEKIAAYDRP